MLFIIGGDTAMLLRKGRSVVAGVAETAPPQNEEIPFGRFLIAMRANNVLGIVAAIEAADPNKIAEALRLRDGERVIRALGGSEMGETVDAILCLDKQKLDKLRRGIDAEKIATALQTRDVKPLAAALRGRQPGRILEAVRKNDVKEILAALEDRGAGRKGRPISEQQAHEILSALTEGGQAASDILKGLRALGCECVVSPLPPSQAARIVDALNHHNKSEKVIRALNDHRRLIWDQILGAVMPKVALAIVRRFSAVPHMRSDDAVNSLAMSLVASMMRGVEEGDFHDYDLESANDIAGLFVRVAWWKACKRLRAKYLISISDSRFGGGAGDNGDWEPIDDSSPEKAFFEDEMRAQFHAILDEFEAALECIDRVILENKLADPPASHEYIAHQVIAQCGPMHCSVRTISRHWGLMRERLKRLLRDAGVGSDEE
jgi:hypothetical protein